MWGDEVMRAVEDWIARSEFLIPSTQYCVPERIRGSSGNPELFAAAWQIDDRGTLCSIPTKLIPHIPDSLINISPDFLAS